MKRQQEFMKIVVAEVSDIKNILALPQLLEQAARHVRTDISISQLIGFSHIVRNINPDEIITVVLLGNNEKIDGLDYVVLEEDFLQETVRRYIYWDDPNFEE